MKKILLFITVTLSIACNNRVEDMDMFICGKTLDIGLSQKNINITSAGGDITITTIEKFGCLYKLRSPFKEVNNIDKKNIFFDGGWFRITQTSDKKFVINIDKNDSGKDRNTLIRVSDLTDSYVGLLYINQR